MERYWGGTGALRVTPPIVCGCMALVLGCVHVPRRLITPAPSQHRNAQNNMVGRKCRPLPREREHTHSTAGGDGKRRQAREGCCSAPALHRSSERAKRLACMLSRDPNLASDR